MISSKISIHVPSWGTTDYRHTGSKDRKNFNPRSLVGNDSQYQPVLRSLQDFNPRSLVGNDGESSLETQIYIISIHVPSWGTTRTDGNRSTHNHDFNPRSLVGNDEEIILPDIPEDISIHVPSWGTTLQNLTNKHMSINFNPRSLVGNDGKFSQIFFVFLCNKYNFSTFYYPFSLFFSVIHVTFLIFVVRILPAFYVYF